jgi:hypothetical protein
MIRFDMSHWFTKEARARAIKSIVHVVELWAKRYDVEIKIETKLTKSPALGQHYVLVVLKYDADYSTFAFTWNEFLDDLAHDDPLLTECVYARPAKFEFVDGD